MVSNSPNAQVAEVLNAYPRGMRSSLLTLRSLIMEVAAANADIGELVETLKWGQLSYLPRAPRVGTTIRIDRVKSDDHKYAVYVHCQTNLIETFKNHYPDQFEFEGNRAIVFDTRHKIPEKALSHCIALALTYHLWKSRKVKTRKAKANLRSA